MRKIQEIFTKTESAFSAALYLVLPTLRINSINSLKDPLGGLDDQSQVLLCALLRTYRKKLLGLDPYR